MMELRICDALDEVGKDAWDSLHGRGRPPHLRYEFLAAFEKTRCVGEGTGWAPHHLCLWRDGALVAAAPAYLKADSSGEFVFDHSWADFCHAQFGEPYYPKLVVAVPFTPATGPRLLCAESEDAAAYRALASGLRTLCDDCEMSGAHVLFPHPEEAERLAAGGMRLRVGIQYHWRNDGYTCFEDFVQRFSSKRRNQIRRERRAVLEQGLEIEVFTGSDITPEIVDHAFIYYLDTVRKHFYGRQYLNRAFFEEVCGSMAEDVLVVLARERASRRFVAGAFNLIGGDSMYGRYWGATHDYRYLHFNVCYYRGIEECIARGLQRFEPGAGGEHKVARGFEPTRTYSAHQVRHPQFARVVYDFLSREREAIDRHLASEKPLLKALRGSDE